MGININKITFHFNTSKDINVSYGGKDQKWSELKNDDGEKYKEVTVDDKVYRKYRHNDNTCRVEITARGDINIGGKTQKPKPLGDYKVTAIDATRTAFDSGGKKYRSDETTVEQGKPKMDVFDTKKLSERLDEAQEETKITGGLKSFSYEIAGGRILNFKPFQTKDQTGDVSNSQHTEDKEIEEELDEQNTLEAKMTTGGGDDETIAELSETEKKLKVEAQDIEDSGPNDWAWEEEEEKTSKVKPAELPNLSLKSKMETATEKNEHLWASCVKDNPDFVHKLKMDLTGKAQQAFKKGKKGYISKHEFDALNSILELITSKEDEDTSKHQLASILKIYFRLNIQSSSGPKTPDVLDEQEIKEEEKSNTPHDTPGDLSAKQTSAVFDKKKLPPGSEHAWKQLIDGFVDGKF